MVDDVFCKAVGYLLDHTVRQFHIFHTYISVLAVKMMHLITLHILQYGFEMMNFGYHLPFLFPFSKILTHFLYDLLCLWNFFFPLRHCFADVCLKLVYIHKLHICVFRNVFVYIMPNRKSHNQRSPAIREMVVVDDGTLRARS